MATTIKRLGSLLFFICFVFNGIALSEEIPGPYGLNAVILEKQDQPFLAWKMPGNEKLLFVGTLYDGKENLTLKYSLEYLGAQRLENNSFFIEEGEGKQGILYVFVDPGCNECRTLYKALENEDVAVRWIPISLDKKHLETAAAWLKNDKLYSNSIEDPIQEYFKKVKENNLLYRWLLWEKDVLTTPLIAWTEGRAVKIFSDPLSKDKLKDLIRNSKNQNS